MMLWITPYGESLLRKDKISKAQKVSNLQGFKD